MSSDKSNSLCEMLPWYVNGTLNDIEIRAMEDHLTECEACPLELPVLERLQKLLHKKPVAVLPPAPKTAEFVARLNRHRGPRFATGAKWLVMAAAAAAGVAMLAVAISNYYSTRPVTGENTFETVIGTDSIATFDYVLHVSLQPEVNSVEYPAILKTLAPVSVADLETAGNFKVVVRLQAQSVDELERYRLDIESNPSISNVSVVAIELPMAPR